MFRMPVEDVFVIRNRGVVATGRVECGTLKVGAAVQINGSHALTVDVIEKFRKQKDEGTRGENPMLGQAAPNSWSANAYQAHAGH